MEIFNKSLFGDDAIEFCKLPKEQKENWIRKYTNQQNDEIIGEFLNNPLKDGDGDCGCGCGGKKATDGNISTSNDATVENSIERRVAKKPSSKDSIKR